MRIALLCPKTTCTSSLGCRGLSFGSDEASLAPEGVFLKSYAHPRAFGNVARRLGGYVRDQNGSPRCIWKAARPGRTAHNLASPTLCVCPTEKSPAGERARTAPPNREGCEDAFGPATACPARGYAPPAEVQGSEMHSQPDDRAKIVRLGLNAIRANLWIRDAIPDARNIEREAFVEVDRQRADPMVGVSPTSRLVYWRRCCRC